MSHIQLNYAFLLFISILGEIHRELRFLVKKVTISEMSTEILRKFVFVTRFEREYPEEIWISLKSYFWSNQLKGININKKCFSPQSEPHTAKLCLSVVLNHLGGNSQRTSLFSQKSDSLKTSTDKLRNFFFLAMFEKMQILRKIWIC